MPTHKKLVALLSLAAGMFSAGLLMPTSAHAITIGINENATALTSTWAATEVGWFYTPTTTFNLTSVETRFSSVGTANTVTFELRATSGGTTIGSLIQSGTLTPSTSFSAATISGSVLNANTTYFFGFRNVGGLGTNVTSDTGAQSLGTLRYSTNNNGSYSNSETGVTAQPILRFNGASVVPEANTAALLGLAIPVIGLVASRNRVVIARRRSHSK